MKLDINGTLPADRDADAHVGLNCPKMGIG